MFLIPALALRGRVAAQGGDGGGIAALSFRHAAWAAKAGGRDGPATARRPFADIKSDFYATRRIPPNAPPRNSTSPPKGSSQLACGPHSTCGRLAPVGKHGELRLRILEGKSDANINFDELRHLLQWLGFEERIRGSHHIFRKQGVRELINLQEEGSQAKAYQVRQVRQIILRYGLEGEER